MPKSQLGGILYIFPPGLLVQNCFSVYDSHGHNVSKGHYIGSNGMH